MSAWGMTPAPRADGYSPNVPPNLPPGYPPPGYPPPNYAQAPMAMPMADTLRSVRVGYCALVAVAAILQVIFFSGFDDNLLSVLVATASSLAGIWYALDSERFRFQPISALILLFYTTTATSGALLVKTLEWTPLAERLQVPLLTFMVLAGTQLSLLAADQIYLRVGWLQKFRRFLSERVLQPIGVFYWPSDTQFWVLGIVGCVSVMMTGTDYESGATFGMSGAGDKVIRAFGFLKFAPFLIPFRNALSGVPSRQRTPFLGLLVFFVALVGISFATNSRSTFADAIPTIGICVLLAMALGKLDFAKIPKARLVFTVLGIAFAAVALSRVALAMVVVRDYRYTVDVGTLIRMTVQALFDNEWLEGAKAKMDTATYVGNYSEVYVDSRFFARFLLTKFHDNILYYFQLFGPDHIEIYKQFMHDRFAATLPDPLLRLFNIAINKEDLIVSNGDYIVYIIDGWGLGGFKTGSMIAEVFAVYQWGFPAVIVVCALMLYVFHDAFAIDTPDGGKALSPLIILLIWNLVGTTASFGLGAETVTAIPSGIARGLPQNVVIYLIAIAGVRGFSRLTGRG